ncbi:MAG: ribonuclease HI family protein [Gemmataceae bacterium]
MPEETIIHTDGASRGNPGAAAYAYVIERDGETVEEAGCLGTMTNNQAEYTALVKALEHALQLGAERVTLHSDSELMVKQMRGEYKVKNEDLKDLYDQARRLAARVRGGVTFRHVRREMNKRADQLCNEALDGKRELTAEQLIAQHVAKSPTSLRDEAIDCLAKAGVKPSAEAVWKQLAGLLERHGLRLPAGSR